VAAGEEQRFAETGEREREVRVDFERAGVGLVGEGDVAAREVNVAEQRLRPHDFLGASAARALEQLLDRGDGGAFLTARCVQPREQDLRAEMRGIPRERERRQLVRRCRVAGRVLGTGGAVGGTRARLELLDGFPGGDGGLRLVGAQLELGDEHGEVDVRGLRSGEAASLLERGRELAFHAEPCCSSGVGVGRVRLAQALEQDLALRVRRPVAPEAQLTQIPDEREVRDERLEPFGTGARFVEITKRPARLGEHVATERGARALGAALKERGVLAGPQVIADEIGAVGPEGRHEREGAAGDGHEKQPAEHAQRPARALRRLEARHHGRRGGGGGLPALLRDGAELHVLVATRSDGANDGGLDVEAVAARVEVDLAVARPSAARAHDAGSGSGSAARRRLRRDASGSLRGDRCLTERIGFERVEARHVWDRHARRTRATARHDWRQLDLAEDRRRWRSCRAEIEIELTERGDTTPERRRAVGSTRGQLPGARWQARGDGGQAGGCHRQACSNGGETGGGRRQARGHCREAEVRIDARRQTGAGGFGQPGVEEIRQIEIEGATTRGCARRARHAHVGEVELEIGRARRRQIELGRTPLASGSGLGERRRTACRCR
jgi:hypothetical protein